MSSKDLGFRFLTYNTGYTYPQFFHTLLDLFYYLPKILYTFCENLNCFIRKCVFLNSFFKFSIASLIVIATPQQTDAVFCTTLIPNPAMQNVFDK